MNQPNLKEFNFTEDEIIDIFNKIKDDDDDDVPNDREERNSVFKMTEQSRNLLNSTGEMEKSLEDEIDIDNLLSLGLKSSEEINDSVEISDDVVQSPHLKMSSGMISDSMNNVQNSEIKFDCSLQFESQREKQSDLQENLVESENLDNIAKDNQDKDIHSKEQESSNSSNDAKLGNTNESDNSGNMNKSDDAQNMKNIDIVDTPGDNLEEEADFIDMNKNQSMIKLKTKNSNEKKVESKSNTSQQV